LIAVAGKLKGTMAIKRKELGVSLKISQLSEFQFQPLVPSRSLEIHPPLPVGELA